jgi:pectate lyase
MNDLFSPIQLMKQAADRDQRSSGRIRSEGDLFLNGGEQWAACASDAGGDETPWDFEVQDCYQSCSVQPASVALKKLLQCCTGWEPVPLPPDISSTGEMSSADPDA